jgi:hypothetical protein
MYELTPNIQEDHMLILSIGTDSESDLTSFYHWLLADEDIHRTVSLELGQSSPELGSMGSGTLDIINLAVTSGFSAANLAIAFATWRDAHGKIAKLSVRNGRRKVVIEGATHAEIARLTEILSDDK